jgi:energy-coupling factor transport system substrate-specific component
MKIKLSFINRISKKLLCITASAVLLTTAMTAVPFRVRGDEIVAGEELSVDPTGKGEGYSTVLYDNTSGLPTSEANDIVETSEGFIWIGSYSGLIRYDGNTFERIDSTTGIASVVNLFVDSKDRLWVGTNDSGAAVMEKGEFTIYNKENGLTSLSIRSITEDNDGNIYLGTTQGIALIDESGKLSMIDEPQINNGYIRMLNKGSGDTIYGITIDGAVFTLENKRLKSFIDPEQLGIEDAHSILPDPAKEGYIYIGTKDNAVYHGELSKGFKNTAPTDISPLGYVNSMCSVGDMLWVCADNGIGFIDGGKFTVLENIPLTTSIEDMMTDYQKNLWFVSSQQGVMKIVPNQFTDIFEKYKLDNEVVYSTCAEGGRLYIGTKNSGLLVLSNGRKVETLPITSSKTASGEVCEDTDLISLMQGCKIRSIIRDSKNRVWFSTFGEQGLLRYDNGNIIKFTVADGMPSERVRTVIERSDGTFVAVCTGGAAVIKDDKIIKVYGENDGISNTEILTAAESANGDLILGTDGGGIFVISENETIHRGTDDGLHSDVIMRIKKDISRDIYWIVTSNSLAYMDAAYNITTIQKFPYSNNFDLYENSRGEMWILSSNGIYVEKCETLLKNEELSPIYYGRDNGLSCITTSNSYSELTPDGDLYISGTTGVAKVNIEKEFENVNSIKLSVPYAEADGKMIYPDSEGNIVIPSTVKKLTIYSFAYNYSLINPEITYCLEGFDKSPVTIRRSELAPVSYTNLHGGTYSFVMKVKDPRNDTSKELVVKIVKEKAIYEKLWFMLMCAAIVLGIIFLIFKKYTDGKTARFLEKEKEQKTLIREIVEAFAKVIDMKDKYTNGHSTRVAEYTMMLARELGIDEETVEKYYNIALLHDIGKVGVPAEVLNKPGKLTDQEFKIIKSHSSQGYNTLKNISIMPELAIGAGAHHERPDGKGYPKGLKGDEIPRVAQIIAVADTFDAMYSDRPYRKRMNFDKAVSIMKEVKGTQLTEDVVDAFLRLVDKGEFRAPDDEGDGTTEDIDNIHKRQNKEAESRS